MQRQGPVAYKVEERFMGSKHLDQKIVSFLHRKEAEFPELAQSGRIDERTRKYAADLRKSGQLPFSR